jgi:hypothetical protein
MLPSDIAPYITTDFRLLRLILPSTKLDMPIAACKQASHVQSPPFPGQCRTVRSDKNPAQGKA